MLQVALAIAAVAIAVTPAAADRRCATSAAIPTMTRLAPAPHRALAGPKQDREGFGSGHQLRTSANFGVRWQDAPVSEAEAQRVLADAEAAWRLYTEGFGHAPPFGTDRYRLNIYISEGPADVPAITWDGGLADSDAEGFPYFVISHSMLANSIDTKAVVAHELYHDFQISLGGFESEPSWWYWEATAEWAAQEVLPDDPSVYYYAGAFALSEQLALFQVGDLLAADEIVGTHQYGAALVPGYFTTTRSRAIVPTTWNVGKPNSDATSVLFAQLAPDPAGVADAFAEFAAHAVHWDMPRGGAIRPIVEEWVDAYPDKPRHDASVAATGTRGPERVEILRALRPFGYHTIELARPAGGKLELVVYGEATDDALFRATLVVKAGETITYTPLAFTDNTGVLDAELAEGTTAHLVVGVTSSSRDAGKTYTYEFQVGHRERTGETAGCSTSSSTSGGVALVLLALLRRRQRFAAKNFSASA